jgi:hypothetical protein
MKLSIDIQHNSIDSHYAEFRNYFNVMLSVVRLNVVMLRVVSPVKDTSLKCRPCDTQHKGLIVTLSIDETQHNSIECHYAECRIFSVMLDVITANVVMLSDAPSLKLRSTKVL